MDHNASGVAGPPGPQRQPRQAGPPCNGDVAGGDAVLETAGPVAAPQRVVAVAVSWCRKAIAKSRFWRRRAAVLALGMGVFGLMAWAGNGALHSTLAPGVAALGASHPPAAAVHSGKPGAALTHGAHPDHGSSSPGTPAASHGPAQHQGASSPATNPASSAGDLLAGGTPGPGAAQGSGSLLPCPARDVALGLFTPRTSYLHGQQPEFAVTAVSTAPWPCQFNIGTRFTSVVISAGHATVWNSASCPSRPGSDMVTLTRGKPALTWVTWNRRTPPASCRAAGHFARRGSYTATAVSQHLKSQALIFELAGRQAAVP